MVLFFIYISSVFIIWVGAFFIFNDKGSIDFLDRKERDLLETLSEKDKGFIYFVGSVPIVNTILLIYVLISLVKNSKK